MGYIASTRSLRKFPSLVWISSLPSVRLLNSFESHDPPIFYHTLSLRLNFDSPIFSTKHLRRTHVLSDSVSPVEEISSRRPSIPSETRLVGRKLIRAGGEREREIREMASDRKRRSFCIRRSFFFSLPPPRATEVLLSRTASWLHFPRTLSIP